MIPRAKQLFVARIPDCEGKIAPQMLHARRSPSRIGMQNQFRVGSVWRNHAAGALQLGDEFHPPIESRVRGNPKSPIEACWLVFAQRFARGPQHRMTQPDRTIHPALAGIWATVSEKIYEGLQKCPLHRRTVLVVDADDAAQSACLSIRVAGAWLGEIGMVKSDGAGRHLRPKRHPESTRACTVKRSSPQRELHS